MTLVKSLHHLSLLNFHTFFSIKLNETHYYTNYYIVEIDISKYIKQGKNSITFTSDEFYSNSARKGVRLYIELVKKDENEYIW